jgi:hypothetical protein
MLNVYLDPSSYIYLSNEIFKEGLKHDRDNWLLPWRLLKARCLERGININTIDLWEEKKETSEDIYLSIDHKSPFRRIYWHFLRNKRYPIRINLNKFKKKILFQVEPPVVMPDVYEKIDSVVEKYDEAYFISRTNNPKCRYFLLYQTYNQEISEYWNNTNRKFLTIISTNKSPRPFGKLLTQIGSGAGLKYWGYKELLSERLKVIKFFSKTNEIDVYGNDWNKAPFFPYGLYKKDIQKVYRGPIKNRHQKLSEYKFSIAFENSVSPGFIAERIFDAFYAGTIPIYLGAPDITDYIPKDCFIHMRDFKNYAELRAFLKSLKDSDIENYRNNIHNFFRSEKFKPFTKEYFLDTVMRAIEE